MNDRKENEQGQDQERDLLSRRKLVYAAPLLMSKGLFYRASGCGKVNPLTKPCIVGGVSGS